MNKKIKKYIHRFIGKIIGETDVKNLIKNGLRVGENFTMMSGCIIDYSHCWLITIGNNVTLAPRVHILAHDASTKKFLNYTKIGLVEIGDNVFVGAGSIILPNVKIGSNVVIGAGSVITKDVPNDSLVAGNPAKIICTLTEYLDKNKNLINERPTYDKKWTRECGITNEQKEQMIEHLKSGIGYIE